MRIDLTHVTYDAKRARFLADAVLHNGSHQRAITCEWRGPQTAGFPQITAGLSQEALRAYR